MMRSFSSKPRRARQRRRARSSSVSVTMLPAFLNSTANQQFLDLADGACRVQTLGTDINAVHDGVATEQSIRVFQVVQTLASCLIARIGDETVSLQQTGRANELVGIPPE